MLISRLCGFALKKWVVGLLIGAAAVMFFIVATAGYLDWYYVSATIEKVAGATVLKKEYGPLHCTNLIYVVLYFVGMIATLILSLRIHKGASQKHAAIMLTIVLGNIAMWCVQKVIPWEFELLSVTYLMSGGAFLAVWYMLQDYVHKRDIPNYTPAEKERLGVEITALSMEDKLARVLAVVKDDEPLAIRERQILELILGNKRRREIAEELHLSENTVKTYTRTLYAKLGVSCREELYALLING
jgi:DNA-binding CsgD family transcriptional regulator